MKILLSLLNYWRVTIPLAALILGLLFLNIWVNSEKAEAVAEYERQAEAARAEQLVIDERIIYEEYKENGTINDYVDRMLANETGGQSEQAEIIADDFATTEPVFGERVLLDRPIDARENITSGLVGIEESTGSAKRDENSTDMGASNELSNQEIDFIINNSDLLQ